ncbi:MAG: OmpA family protein [Bacteroidota bacterium]
MLNKLSKLVFILFTSVAFAQTGHLMQGVGAVNMSMGGAATAQPLDISGAIHWNPAALSAFDGSILKFDIGAFKGTPTLYSSLPENMMWAGSPAVTGETESELGYNPMPALAFAWGNPDSKHTFGISAFGISGFGVDFPQETNLPGDSFDPNDSSPIVYPQTMRGFGHVESSYMLMQVGFTWAYQFTDNFSIGFQPTVNYSSLDMGPNPLAQPSMEKGYPTSDNVAALGYGGQVGLFYDSHNGIKLGASYKSPLFFDEFEFDNTYLDETDAPGVNFTMNFPAIYSVGLGYSKANWDFALDYRYVDYENTEGFEASGWETMMHPTLRQEIPTGAVNGFGWENMSIVSTGLQFKGIEKLPLRVGYTYSTNPISDELAMFSVPATAIIAHAFQFGFSYKFSDRFRLDAVYHYGMSDGKTEGNILNPTPAMDFNGDGNPDGPWHATQNPLGQVPGSTVAYDMNTHMYQVGLAFDFSAKDADKDGVPDKEDACPEVAGLEQFNGCPDSDLDGVQDSEDACPNTVGLPALNGCPDKDGDGFSDKDDYCPEVAGLEQFNGCPDSDGDGVMDKMDECPNVAGLAENKGCPLVDTDGDGIADKDDNCPNIAGGAENKGCPVVTEEVQKEIIELAREIFFNTGKATFTEEAKVRLTKINDILKDYYTTKFVVEGHTDNTGSAKFNKELSQKRADAVMQAIVEAGFPADMIKAFGYGEEKPLGDNNTSKGRQANRRVDIRVDK